MSLRSTGSLALTRCRRGSDEPRS